MPNISESNLLRYERSVFWLFNAARKQHKNVKWRYTELLKMLTCLFSAVLLNCYKYTNIILRELLKYGSLCEVSTAVTVSN